MTKKEEKEVEYLKTRLALHFTEDVHPDVLEPVEGIANGYSFNSYSKRVTKSCSSSFSHNSNGWDKTTSQQAISQYSSPRLAFKAMRRELEERFAKELREIDIKIAGADLEL